MPELGEVKAGCYFSKDHGTRDRLLVAELVICTLAHAERVCHLSSVGIMEVGYSLD